MTKSAYTDFFRSFLTLGALHCAMELVEYLHPDEYRNENLYDLMLLGPRVIRHYKEYETFLFTNMKLFFSGVRTCMCILNRKNLNAIRGANFRTPHVALTVRN